MNSPYRRPVTVATIILGLTAVQLARSRAAHACVTTCNIPTYVAGHFNAVSPGDIIGIVDSSGSELYPIISAIGEKYSHVAHNDSAAGNWITEDILDKAQIATGFDCTHPVNPNDLVTARPGVLVQAPADGNFAYTECTGRSCRVIIEESLQGTPWGNVGAGGPNITLIPTGVTGAAGLYGAVHNESKAVCSGYALYDGVGSPGGYHVYAFTHYPGPGQNGMCVDFLNAFCAVPRPTPRTYSLTTAINATNALYNNVWDSCNSGEGWSTSLFCSGACDRAADQFVNSFWKNNSWDYSEYNHSTGAPMVTALSTVVTPDRLMNGFPSSPPVAITATSYTITYKAGLCHVPGNCP